MPELRVHIIATRTKLLVFIVKMTRGTRKCISHAVFHLSLQQPWRWFCFWNCWFSIISSWFPFRARSKIITHSYLGGNFGCDETFNKSEGLSFFTIFSSNAASVFIFISFYSFGLQFLCKYYTFFYSLQCFSLQCKLFTLCLETHFY